MHAATPTTAALNVPLGHCCGAAEAGGQYVPTPHTPLQVLLDWPGPPHRPAGQGCAVALADAAGQKYPGAHGPWHALLLLPARLA